MMPDFSSLFSGPENVFWFVLGIALTYAWQWIKCKWKDYRDPEGKPHIRKSINWFPVAIAFTIIITVAIGVQNQRTYDFATQLAKDTRACQVQFNEALQFNTQITRDNDRWSQIQRKALADWIHDLIFPPPNIAVLPPSDFVRQEWVLARTTEADRVIRNAQLEQDQNIGARKPYPDPTCGK